MQLSGRQTLNDAAFAGFDAILSSLDRWKVRVHCLESGATIVDGDIKVVGGLGAGLEVAKICLANQACVSLVSGPAEIWNGPWVNVTTDFPVAACMASQYAGWSLSHDKYFAMGSGPMRAAAAKEPIFAQLNYRETTNRVVGVLETSKMPPDEIVLQIATACQVEPSEVYLVVAPTASLVGTTQVVARSLETALHKLHELKFNLEAIQSGWGIAPLPPLAKDDITAIGWTNDAILLGASVCLWVDCTDEQIEEVLPHAPSAASPDFGRPFLEIFKKYNHDFYKIDPLLFSPAMVTFFNRRTGRTFRTGKQHGTLLAESYGLA